MGFVKRRISEASFSKLADKWKHKTLTPKEAKTLLQHLMWEAENEPRFDRLVQADIASLIREYKLE